MKETFNAIVMPLTTAAIGIALGYLLADDSRQVRRLESRLARLTQSPNNGDLTSPHRPILLQREIYVSLTNSSNPNSQNKDEQDRKDFRHRLLEEAVAKAATERSDEYTRVFTAFGVPPQDAERFKSNMVVVHQKANVAGESVEDLQRAKSAYDEDVRAVLGEENYAKYYSYEASKQAFKEFDLIRKYASSVMSTEFSQEESLEFVKLIQDANAYTTESWAGPYDPSPHPATGRQQVTKLLNQQIDEIDSESQDLLNAARTSGKPSKFLDVAQAYYSEILRQRQSLLESMTRPPEEVLRESLAEDQERLRKAREKVAPGQR